MPVVYRLQAIDRGDFAIVLETLSRSRPTREDGEKLLATCERYYGLAQVELDVDIVTACRECGCTEDKACPGGCSWAEPDLCSACDRRHIRL